MHKTRRVCMTRQGGMQHAHPLPAPSLASRNLTPGDCLQPGACLHCMVGCALSGVHALHGREQASEQRMARQPTAQTPYGTLAQSKPQGWDTDECACAVCMCMAWGETLVHCLAHACSLPLRP